MNIKRNYKTSSNVGDTTMRPVFQSRTLFTCMLAIAVLVTGCAQDMGEIDQVQPNVIKKDLFQGEWYMRNVVVDSPATGAYTFIGDMDKMERGVFDIQEDTLYFYRTYEFAEDSQVIGLRSDKDVPLCRDLEGSETASSLTTQDFEWCNPEVSPSSVTSVDASTLQRLVTRTVEICGEQREIPVIIYRGAPVGAWPISSQFDIIYNYNPTTGEKTNVRVENSSDRHWTEREFMRVDFSANQVGQAYTMGMQNMQAFTVYEGDSAPEGEGIRFEDAVGTTVESGSDVAYFDFLSDQILEGRTAELEGYGTIPYCWYYPWYTGGVYECTSERIRSRTAFLRVDKAIDGGASDFIPTDYDDRHMNRFGYFRTERLNYNCNFGVTYTGAIRRANLHRIWNNYAQNEDGSFDYASMEPRPIVYYMNKNFPRDLLEVSLQLASDWAGPFNDAVAARKGGAPDFPMFILCENSDAEAQAAADAGQPTACWSGSSEAHCAQFCKQMDRSHENGDLRYNYLHAVVEPLQAGLYGYGPSSADPLTGEIISAGAYVYVNPMLRGARSAIDIIEYAAGIKDWREVENAIDHTNANRLRRLQVNGDPPYYTVDQAKEVARNLLSKNVSARLSVDGPRSTDRDFSSERLSRIKDAPELEAIMGGDYIRHLFKDPRVGNGHVLSGEEQKEFSLANFKHHGGYIKQMDYYRSKMEKNLYLEEFVDGAVLGLAEEYGKKYDEEICGAVANAQDAAVDMGQFSEANPCTTRKVIDALAAEIRRVDVTNPNAVYLPMALWWSTKDDRIHATQKLIRDTIDVVRKDFHKKLWQQIYYGVAEHEVGHTLGLRHNFEGSTDAMNYFASYWDHRGEEGSSGWEPIGGAFGDESLEQNGAHMRQLQNSTVMDYGAKFNARFEGVGHYDHAAIKYAYGQVVEKFNQPMNLDPYLGYLDDPSDENPEYSVNFQRDKDPVEDLFRRVHYTEIPKIFGGDASAVQDRSDVPVESLAGDACSNEGGDTCGAGQYCEHYFHGDFCTDIGAHVPYRFCSDELAGYTPSCDVWDEGANSYEIVRNAFSDYENYWPFWGFMRDNLMFNPSNYSNRVYRTFKLGQRHFQYWVSEYARYNKDGWWASRFSTPYEEDINGGLGGSIAAVLSFNSMAQVFGRPITSWYAFNTRTGRYEPWTQQDREYFDDTTFVWVGEEAGSRQMYSSYDYSGNLPIVNSAGAIYDRLNALEVLTDPGTFMWAQAPNEEMKRFLISYYTAFPVELTDLLGSIMVDEHDNFGWCVQTSATLGGDALAARRRDFVGPNKGACDGAGEIALFPEPKYTFPTTKFRMPALAGLYGMSYMTEDFDTSFIDVSHIYLKGHEDAVSAPEGVETIEFEDPLSGKTYIAHNVGGEMMGQCSGTPLYDGTPEVPGTDEVAGACSNTAGDCADDNACVVPEVFGICDNALHDPCRDDADCDGGAVCENYVPEDIGTCDGYVEATAGEPAVAGVSEDCSAVEDCEVGALCDGYRASNGLYNPGYELIKRAKAEFEGFVAEEYYLSELQYLIGKLEIVRGLGSLYSNY